MDNKYILGNKVYSDSTLKSWKKDDLIEFIRVLEHNWNAAEETINQQFENFTNLLDQVEFRSKLTFANELYALSEECGPGLLFWTRARDLAFNAGAESEITFVED